MIISWLEQHAVILSGCIKKFVAVFHFKSMSQQSFLSWVFLIFYCLGIIYLEHTSNMKNNGDFWEIRIN